MRATGGIPIDITADDPSIVYKGDWERVEVGNPIEVYQETIQNGAKLSVVFYGDTNIDLTMGMGVDCGIYDVYINKTLWQSFDGYAPNSDTDDVISLDVTGQGPHLLEIYQRMEKNSASSGYRVRFKELAALDATEITTIDYTYDDISRLTEANYDGGTAEYTYGYDLAGNLVNKNGTTRTFNAANQMTNNGTNTLDYDNNGNLWKTNSVVSHTWDRANRLLSHGGSDYTYEWQRRKNPTNGFICRH